MQTADWSFTWESCYCTVAPWRASSCNTIYPARDPLQWQVDQTRVAIVAAIDMWGYSDLCQLGQKTWSYMISWCRVVFVAQSLTLLCDSLVTWECATALVALWGEVKASQLVIFNFIFTYPDQGVVMWLSSTHFLIRIFFYWEKFPWSGFRLDQAEQYGGIENFLVS